MKYSEYCFKDKYIESKWGFNMTVTTVLRWQRKKDLLIDIIYKHEVIYDFKKGDLCNFQNMFKKHIT